MGSRKDRVLALVARLGRGIWVSRRAFWRGQGSNGVDTKSICIIVSDFCMQGSSKGGGKSSNAPVSQKHGYWQVVSWRKLSGRLLLLL